jgi:hypothetical protein
MHNLQRLSVLLERSAAIIDSECLRYVVLRISHPNFQGEEPLEFDGVQCHHNV